MKKEILIAIGIVILFLGFGIQPAIADIVYEPSLILLKGKTLYVGGSGLGNYSKIQDAIDNASNGDTIFVYNDSSPYYENIVITIPGINLIGEDRKTTIIDGIKGEDVIEVLTYRVYICGFTIRNSGYGNSGSGISITQLEHEGKILNNNYITNNIISNNYCGIHFGHSNRNKIINNIIKNNQYGVSILHSDFHIIIGNTISNNSKGISTKYSFGSIIFGNNITLNKEYGFYITQYGGNFIIKNNIIGNHIGAYFEQVGIRNRWKQNFWNEPRTLPKIIFGKLIIIGNSMPIAELIVIGIDWRPALKPYDIEV